jgi:hypothetical protein
MTDGADHDWHRYPFAPDSRDPAGEFVAAERAFRRKRAAIFDRSRILEIDLPLRHDVAARFVPLWLSLDRVRSGVLFVAEHGRASFCDPYVEVGLLLPVRGVLGAGVLIVWMVVDNDTALLVGREWLAVPKKMAEMALRRDERTVAAAVTRRGSQILTASAVATDEVARMSPFYDQPTYSVGGLGQFGLVNLVWAWRAKETVIECRAMRAMVAVQDSAFDPVGRLAAATDDLPAREFTVTCHRGRYLCPVGIAGPRWFARTYDSRYR